MKLWWCHSSTWRSTSFLREARTRLVHLSIVVRSDSNKLCLMKDNSAHVVPGHAACVWSLVHVQPRNVEVLGLERNFLEIYEGFIASDLWVSVDYERPPPEQNCGSTYLWRRVVLVCQFESVERNHRVHELAAFGGRVHVRTFDWREIGRRACRPAEGFLVELALCLSRDNKVQHQ